MSLVPSLLHAIVSLDGEALVVHVGEKPYVVTPSGQVELATRGLTLEAVTGILDQMLPDELQRALDEFGAIQHEFPASPEFPREHFTIVAARGGDDVWVEIRRRRLDDDDMVPLEMFETPAPVPDRAPAAVAARGDAADLEIPDPSHLWGGAAAAPARAGGQAGNDDLDLGLHEPRAASSSPTPPIRMVPRPVDVAEPAPASAPAASLNADVFGAAPKVTPAFVPTPAPPVTPVVSPAPVPPTARPAPPAEPVAVAPAAAPVPAASFTVTVPHAPVAPTGAASPAAPHTYAVPPSVPSQAAGHFEVPPAPPAVVVPLARNPVRPETPILPLPSAGLDRLLRLSAARGATALYVSSQAHPSVRVDGEIQALDSEPPLGPSEVESLLLDMIPERDRETLRAGSGTEWITDISGVGRVRCMTFRDHRGPGGIFRLMPQRALSAEQLGLSRELQALAFEPEGLVLVSGPRSSGKSTLVSGFVDLINRTRRDHVITIESEIKIVHEHRQSFISQREVRGSNEELLAAARAAMREDPDVLVIEELRTADLVTVALDAAGSGRLVIGALPAHTATGAVDRIIDLYPPEYRRYVQLALAESLRGIVVQVLLRRPTGGRVAAREVLLNTPAVAGVIAEGKTSQLASAMEGGRRFGMVPLNDALIAYVQAGVIDVREAYRRAADRAGFLAQMRRLGLDTSFAERLA